MTMQKTREGRRSLVIGFAMGFVFGVILTLILIAVTPL